MEAGRDEQGAVDGPAGAGVGCDRCGGVVGPLGGDRRSQHMEGHAETILGLLKARPDATLAELQAALAERGVAASSSGLWRFFQRRRITLKKSRPMRTSRTAPTS